MKAEGGDVHQNTPARPSVGSAVGMTKLVSVLFAGTALCAGMLVVGAVSAAGAAAAVVPVPVPLGQPPAIPSGAADLGSEPAQAILKLDVALRPRDPVALRSFLQDLDNPSSATYHQFLAPGQFGPRFGAAPATVAAVDSVLSSMGLAPGAVTNDRLLVPVTTTAGAVEAAFGIQIDQYRLPTGYIGFAATAAPKVPSSIVGDLEGIVGLSSLGRPRPLNRRSEPTRRSGPTAGVSAAPGAVHADTYGPHACTIPDHTTYGYTATQLAAVYGFTSGAYSKGDLGAGETVGLFELASYRETTVTAYERCYGISTTVQKVTVDGGNGTVSGTGAGEVDLDIDDVAGLAPDASIDVFVAPNTNQGLLADYQAIATTATVRVVSSSWGLCEPESTRSLLMSEETIFEQMAAQGQSMMAAAGDTGSEDCVTFTKSGTGRLAVDDPASDPWVTGVGGLDLTKLTPPTESVWNEASTDAGAGGGGISAIWSMPTYQKAVGVFATSSGTPCSAPATSDCREVPDVSASADPYHGYASYFDSAWTWSGGTSAAAPLWAALTVLADERCGPSARAGLLNPALYAHESDLSDVTAGNNTYTGKHTGHYGARTGYDMASGLGAPTAALFAPGVLCTATTTATVPAKPSSPTATPGNASATVTWSAPTTGGSPITSYAVTASPGGRTCTWTSGPLACTVKKLTNGTSYTFTVRATNAVGKGPASTPSTPVTPFGPPGKPAAPNATAGNATATVTWSAPATHGSAITRYTVKSSGGQKCTWTSGPLTCTVTKLTNGKRYTFTVKATNAAGTGPPSKPSNSVTPEA